MLIVPFRWEEGNRINGKVMGMECTFRNTGLLPYQQCFNFTEGQVYPTQTRELRK